MSKVKQIKFLSEVNAMRKTGFSNRFIADRFGMTTKQLREAITEARKD